MFAAGRATHKVVSNLTLADFQRYARLACRRRILWGPACHFIVGFSISVYFSFLTVDWLNAHKLGIHSGAMLPLLSALFISVYMKLLGIKARLAESQVGRDLYWTKPKVVELTPNSIHMKSEHSSVTTDWNGVIKIAETSKLIFLLTGNSSGYAIPRRSFESKEAADAFVAAAREYWAAAKEAAVEDAAAAGAGAA